MIHHIFLLAFHAPIYGDCPLNCRHVCFCQMRPGDYHPRECTPHPHGFPTPPYVCLCGSQQRAILPWFISHISTTFCFVIALLHLHPGSKEQIFPHSREDYRFVYLNFCGRSFDCGIQAIFFTIHYTTLALNILCRKNI